MDKYIIDGGRKAKLTLDDGTEYSWVIEEIEIIRT